MSKLTMTNFSKRTGSPFQKTKETQEDTKNKVKEPQEDSKVIVHEEFEQKPHIDKQKEKQNELLQKVNKKTAEYQASKPSSGVFTEVVTHGAFTSKTANKDKSQIETVSSPSKSSNGLNSSKLLGFPSSANDLALDAKTDLESDKNISKEVKEKVIEKLFTLVSMVQHMYESKVRIMTEYEKFKDTHLKNELRREKEHSEQLYKINMNFQNEVIQSIQRLKSELDISRNITTDIEENGSSLPLRASSVEFHVSYDSQNSDSNKNCKDFEISEDNVELKPEKMVTANEDSEVN